jgi:hypothetical protein
MSRPSTFLALIDEDVDAGDKPGMTMRKQQSLSPVGALWMNAMLP